MRIGFQPIALPTELDPVDCGRGIEPLIPGSRPGVLPLNEPQSADGRIRTYHVQGYEPRAYYLLASSTLEAEYFPALCYRGVRRCLVLHKLINLTPTYGATLYTGLHPPGHGGEWYLSQILQKHLSTRYQVHIKA